MLCVCDMFVVVVAFNCRYINLCLTFSDFCQIKMCSVLFQALTLIVY